MSEQKSKQQLDEIDTQVKPLNEDDVLNEMKLIARTNEKVTTDIFNTYFRGIQSLLTAAAKQTKEETEVVEVERLRRLIGLMPIEETFIRTKDKIWAVRKRIMQQDADYFMNKDYSKIIKRDANQAFIESLMEIIKDRFEDMDDLSKKFYWCKAALLLNCVARFKKELANVK